MDLHKTVTAKDVEILAETKQTTTSKYQVRALTDLKPLPEGRPIAANTSEGMADVLGYLD